jgi:hypothetical protein
MQGDARRVPEVNLLPDVDPPGITEKPCIYAPLKVFTGHKDLVKFQIAVILVALQATKARILVFRFIIEYSSLKDFGP